MYGVFIDPNYKAPTYLDLYRIIANSSSLDG